MGGDKTSEQQNSFINIAKYKAKKEEPNKTKKLLTLETIPPHIEIKVSITPYFSELYYED